MIRFPIVVYGLSLHKPFFPVYHPPAKVSPYIAIFSCLLNLLPYHVILNLSTCHPEKLVRLCVLHKLDTLPSQYSVIKVHTQAILFPAYISFRGWAVFNALALVKSVQLSMYKPEKSHTIGQCKNTIGIPILSNTQFIPLKCGKIWVFLLLFITFFGKLNTTNNKSGVNFFWQNMA